MGEGLEKEVPYLIAVDGYCSTYEKEKLVVLGFSASESGYTVGKMSAEEVYSALRSGRRFEKEKIEIDALVEKKLPILYISSESDLAPSDFSGSDLAKDNLAVNELSGNELSETRLEIVCAGTVSGGIGLLADLAVRNRENGMSLFENAAKVRECVKQLKTYLVSNDIIYMKRSGILSNAVSSGGLMIGMKSVFTVTDGKLKIANKIRGNKVIAEYLLEKLEQDVMSRDIDAVYVFSGKADELKNVLLDELRGRFPEVKTVSGEIEAHQAALLGPGTLLMSWM